MGVYLENYTMRPSVNLAQLTRQSCLKVDLSSRITLIFKRYSHKRRIGSRELVTFGGAEVIFIDFGPFWLQYIRNLDLYCNDCIDEAVKHLGKSKQGQPSAWRNKAAEKPLINIKFKL